MESESECSFHDVWTSHWSRIEHKRAEFLYLALQNLFCGKQLEVFFPYNEQLVTTSFYRVTRSIKKRYGMTDRNGMNA